MADNNFLNFTGLTYSDIVEQVNNMLAGDPRFENFRESAIARTVIEIFAACTDITNHYLERRAEESYLDTAKLKSSVILLSRMIGYVPIRPIPASTSMKMIISGPLPGGLTTSDQIVLSAGTVFDYNGTPFRLNKTYVYTFTSSDLSLGSNSTFSKEIQYSLESDSSTLSIVTSPDISAVDAGIVKTIDLMQGEILTNTILGSSNPFVGQVFQRYKISDTTVSNLYGQEDIGYDASDDSFNYNSNLTRVTVGSTEFRIDRRSLFNNKTIFNFNQTSSTENMCILRSAIDESVELIFGDDNYAAIGARTTSDDVVLTYFSTLGSQANQTGVVGDTVETNSQFSSNSIDLTSNISFELTRNITNGADFEDIESIRFNAPNIFYSLDRLVTMGDYVSYMKSLTSPINVKNAVAWGEQEEGQGVAIKKLANVVLFSVLGSMYNQDSFTKNWSLKTVSGTPPLTDAFLEGSEELSTNYFNILIKESVVDELRLYSSATAGYDNIKTVTDNLNKRSQITARTIYMKPIVQEFDIPMIVYVKKLTDLNNTKIAIKNRIYAFLDENADFAKPVYKSNLIELAESLPQVSHIDFNIQPDQTNVGTKFEVYESEGLMYANSASDLVNWVTSGNGVGVYDLTELGRFYINTLAWYLSTSAGTSGVGYSQYSDLQYLFTNVTLSASLMKQEILNYFTNVTERSFYNIFIKKLYEVIKDYELNTLGLSEDDSDHRFTQSENFLSSVTKLHNSFSYIIKYNMMTNDNIQNFSLRNEISKFTLENMIVIYV